MQHLIFEGAELAGKSWLMSQVYDHLEPKYNQSGVILDGCHWFNCDVGVFGTPSGKNIIELYFKMFSELKESNLLVEKFHLSDIVYNRIHQNNELDYYGFEKKLLELNFKLITVTFPEDEELIKKRIEDRLKIYPHYERILRTPEWYIQQQREYLKELKISILPYLIVETRNLPDNTLAAKIFDWIKE